MNAEGSIVGVECYSGYTADERPLRFRDGADEYVVEAVMYRFYTPYATFFRVRAGDGREYILRHATEGGEDTWTARPATR